jgi:hypothetical protein
LLQRLGDLRRPWQVTFHTDTSTDTSTVQDISEASPERLRARKATAGRIWAYRTRLMQTGADGLAVWRPQARSGLPGIIPYQDTFISASRRCGSSSSSSSSNLSAVSVSVPASSAVNVITLVTPTNQPTNLIPTPLGRYPRTAYSLHSRYSTYTLLLGWSYYSHYSYSCRSQRWGRGCTERAAAAVAAAAASAAAQQIHVSQARDGYPGLSVRTRHRIVLSGQLCSG